MKRYEIMFGLLAASALFATTSSAQELPNYNIVAQ